MQVKRLPVLTVPSRHGHDVFVIGGKLGGGLGGVGGGAGAGGARGGVQTLGGMSGGGDGHERLPPKALQSRLQQ